MRLKFFKQFLFMDCKKTLIPKRSKRFRESESLNPKNGIVHFNGGDLTVNESHRS